MIYNERETLVNCRWVEQSETKNARSVIWGDSQVGTIQIFTAFTCIHHQQWILNPFVSVCLQLLYLSHLCPPVPPHDITQDRNIMKLVPKCTPAAQRALQPWPQKEAPAPLFQNSKFPRLRWNPPAQHIKSMIFWPDLTPPPFLMTELATTNSRENQLELLLSFCLKTNSSIFYHLDPIACLSRLDSLFSKLAAAKFGNLHETNKKK